MQTTSYADGSEKITTNTNAGGTNISQTKVTDPRTGNQPTTNTTIQKGNMKTSFSSNDPKTAKSGSISYKKADGQTVKQGY
jgi:hypothetical protein